MKKFSGKEKTNEEFNANANNQNQQMLIAQNDNGNHQEQAAYEEEEKEQEIIEEQEIPPQLLAHIKNMVETIYPKFMPTATDQNKDAKTAELRKLYINALKKYQTALMKIDISDTEYKEIDMAYARRMFDNYYSDRLSVSFKPNNNFAESLDYGRELALLFRIINKYKFIAFDYLEDKIFNIFIAENPNDEIINFKQKFGFGFQIASFSDPGLILEDGNMEIASTNIKSPSNIYALWPAIPPIPKPLTGRFLADIMDDEVLKKIKQIKNCQTTRISNFSFWFIYNTKTNLQKYNYKRPIDYTTEIFELVSSPKFNI